MAYKIQSLVENGYDFKALYPEKQDSVRESTGLQFYLDGIVSFLQKQTNNFTIDNPIAHDLDNAIYEMVQKQDKEKKPEEKEPTPSNEEAPLEKSEEETRQDILEAIELLEMLGEDADDESKEALEILKLLV